MNNLSLHKNLYNFSLNVVFYIEELLLRYITDFIATHFILFITAYLSLSLFVNNFAPMSSLSLLMFASVYLSKCPSLRERVLVAQGSSNLK